MKRILYAQNMVSKPEYKVRKRAKIRILHVLKNVLVKVNFLISHPNHMLWVLKRPSH